ncbi:MAG: radical SAM protein, partial [Gemmatimonadota bacterium]
MVRKAGSSAVKRAKGPADVMGSPDPRHLLRLPWTASDNAMTWLEPTRRCNITCDACFVENRPESEKTLEQIRYELDFVLRHRRCDAMLVAGGEPLIHPRIVDIVRMVKSAGVKPVIVTNGVTLDRDLVKELKSAGAHGFTIHVDSHQARPGWMGKNEKELNELRDYYAEMLYGEGGLTCAFNTTIFPDTLESVPDIVEWAVGVPERVHILTLICVRTVDPDAPFDYYVGARKVDFTSSPYMAPQRYENLVTEDIYRQIK